MLQPTRVIGAIIALAAAIGACGNGAPVGSASHATASVTTAVDLVPFL